jgi:type I restriction enzyme, S subunit
VRIKNPNYLNIKIPTWDVIPFLAAIKDKTGGNPKVKKSSYKKTGEIAIIDQGQNFIGGYTNNENLICNESLPCILFGDHNKIFKFINFPFALGADGVKILTPKDGFDKKFLFYYLKSLRLPDDVGYSRHYKFLKEKFIVKPPLSEQKRIAAILDKADGIRKKREEALQLADAFLRATFLEMFGDPVTNPKGWEVKPFHKICSNCDSKRVPLKMSDRGKKQGSFPYYGASRIIDYIDEYIFDGKYLLVGEDGANLVARATPIAFIATGKFWVNNHAHVLAGNGSVSLEYLERYFSFIDLKPYITGSAQPKLTRSKLDLIPIPVPPIKLQNKFAEIESRMNKIKKANSDFSSQPLFEVLTQRAFRGEL